MIIEMKPIGTIRTPYSDRSEIPCSTNKGKGIQGRVELNEEYLEGLADLAGFSHIVLIFAFHKSEGFKLTAHPPMIDRPIGLFATRSPFRPNPIGVSIVRLKKIEGNIIHFENVDMLDGTPLLDIKPYTPYFENDEDIKIGWLQGRTRHQ